MIKISQNYKWLVTGAAGFIGSHLVENLLSSGQSVKRVVYASSNAVYEDDETMPKTEEKIGKTLSPFAMTKYFNEVQAEFFTRVYGLKCTGLRYFNVFGKRQNSKRNFEISTCCIFA